MSGVSGGGSGPPIRKRAHEFVSELNDPKSVLSRYSAPMPTASFSFSNEPFIDAHTLVANARHEVQQSQTSRSSLDATTSTPTNDNLNRPNSARGSIAQAGRRAMTAVASTQSQQSPLDKSLVPYNNSSSSTNIITTTTSPSPSTRFGPYHSSLQRNLKDMFPQYTEGQLNLHSKFTASFYLGPVCRSLEDDGLGRLAKGKGGPALLAATTDLPSRGKDKSGYSIGQNALNPSNPGLAPGVYNTVAPLNDNQKSLLQSVFDRVDEAYPPPGSTKKTSVVNATIDAMTGRKTTDHGASDPSGAGGMKRQLMSRPDPSAPGGHVYDVFNIPVGFKIVRDENASNMDATKWSSQLINKVSGGNNNNTTATTAAGPALAANDPALKERMKSVLETLAEKYDIPLSSTGRTGTGGLHSVSEEKQQQQHHHHLQQHHSAQHSVQASPTASGQTTPFTGGTPNLQNTYRSLTVAVPGGSTLQSPAATGHLDIQKAITTPKPVLGLLPPSSLKQDASPASSTGTNSPLKKEVHFDAAPTSGSAATAGAGPASTSAASATAFSFSGNATPAAASSTVVPGGPQQGAHIPFVPLVRPKHIGEDGEVVEEEEEEEVEMETVDFSSGGARPGKRIRGVGGKNTAPQMIVGKSLATSQKKAIKIIPPRGTQLINSIISTVRCCTLVPHTEQVWTAQRDPVLVIRDRITGKVVHRLDMPALIFCMLLIDKVMYMGTETGVILAYHTVSLKRLRSHVAHAGAIHCLTRGLGPDGGIFSGSNDFTMIQWSEKLEQRQAFLGHAGGVRCILAVSAGRVWTGSDDNSIRIWDVESGTTVDELVRHTGSVLSLITTGESIWSASEDGTLCTWSFFPRVHCTKQISTGNDRINFLQLVGSQVWSCGQDPRIQIWDSSSMDWLGSLSGHHRYVSNFAKVRVMESRLIWSFGLGEDNILVWRSEMLSEDNHDKYVALLTQNTTQLDELAHLRAKLAATEAALRASEEARAKEKDLFHKQLEELLLQLAQANANKDGVSLELSQALKDNAALAHQNAKLRNELRLHLEKLATGENVMKNLLDRVGVKEEHIDRLQQDALLQRDKAQKKFDELEAKYLELLAAAQRDDNNASRMAAELLSLQQRLKEKMDADAERERGALFYAGENARLNGEMEHMRRMAQADAQSAELRHQQDTALIARLEASLLEATMNQKLKDDELRSLRDQLAAVTDALNRAQAERDQALAQAKLDRERLEESMKMSAESNARSLEAINTHMRRIKQLEALRDSLKWKLAELEASFDNVARGLHRVERDLCALKQPENEVFNVPQSPAYTFQQAAARRDGYAGSVLESTPPPAFFHELTQTHASVSAIMKHCLRSTQKLHVGYTPAAADQENLRALEREEMEFQQQQQQRQSMLQQQHHQQQRDDRRRSSNPTDAASIPLPSSVEPSPTTDSLAAARKITVVEKSAAAAVVVEDGVDTDDDEDGSGGFSMMDTNAQHNPVRQVWLNPPSNRVIDNMQQPSHPYTTADLQISISQPHSTMPSPSAATAAATTVTRSRPTSSRGPNKALRPLVTYDLESIRPVDALPAPLSTTSNKRAQDAREQKLMQLEKATRERKRALQRQKEGR